MVAALLPALISGGAAVYGAYQDRKQRNKEIAQARKDADPSELRRKFEEAGLDPAWAFGGGYSPAPLPAAPTFGRDIATAASDALEISQRERQLALQKTELEQRNQQLQQRVEQMTLRPETGGLYGGLGSQNSADVSAFGGSGDIVASGRDVRVEPY